MGNFGEEIFDSFGAIMIEKWVTHESENKMYRNHQMIYISYLKGGEGNLVTSRWKRPDKYAKIHEVCKKSSGEYMYIE